MLRVVLVCAMAIGSLTILSAPALADGPSNYPPLQWLPAAAGNYEHGRGGQRISAIVIHETDGSFTSALNWFRKPGSLASAHYLVGTWNGAIAQVVAESDTAYHARSANPWTIGIEHEFWPRYGIYHTDAQYRSSAKLTCAIARRYGIPIDRYHIVGHNELPGNDHRDPGPTWNWTYYMSLVRGCAARPAAANIDLPTHPSPGLAFGDVSSEVALLQWDLVYLGHIPTDEVVAGGRRFGSLTETSLTVFQSTNGVLATGAYGEETAAALARALDADPPDLPAKELETGAESDDVSRLQTTLETIGYMDRVTGYFGPMTFDAVTRFQSDHGIEATGTYEAVTRMALASALRYRVSVAPASETVSIVDSYIPD